MDYALGVISKNSAISLIFSPKNFTVLRVYLWFIMSLFLYQLHEGLAEVSFFNESPVLMNYESPVALVPLLERLSFLYWLIFALCKKSVGPTIMGLFLGSLFCPIYLFVFSFANTTLDIAVYLVDLFLPLFPSFSKLFLLF